MGGGGGGRIISEAEKANVGVMHNSARPLLTSFEFMYAKTFFRFR